MVHGTAEEQRAAFNGLGQVVASQLPPPSNAVKYPTMTCLACDCGSTDQFPRPIALYQLEYSPMEGVSYADHSTAKTSFAELWRNMCIR